MGVRVSFAVIYELLGQFDFDQSPNLYRALKGFLPSLFSIFLGTLFLVFFILNLNFFLIRMCNGEINLYSLLLIPYLFHLKCEEDINEVEFDLSGLLWFIETILTFCCVFVVLRLCLYFFSPSCVLVLQLMIGRFRNFLSSMRIYLPLINFLVLS